jgi:hypothetical protein
VFSADGKGDLGQLCNKSVRLAIVDGRARLGIFHVDFAKRGRAALETMPTLFHCLCFRLLNARDLLIAASLINMSPPASAQAPAKPVSLSEARAELIREGWLPRETYGEFPDGLRWNEDGDAGALYKAGFKEVEACSGTGANYCTFNYVRGGKCLVLHTQGEFEAGKREPVVTRRGSICPRSAITRPAQNAVP